jgi:hypothetical protein
MKRNGMAGYPIIAMGIAFLAIGFNGRKAFIAIGLAFMLIGIVMLRRRVR